MSHTAVPDVSPGQFGKASWADAVRAADLDLTARVEDLEEASVDLPLANLEQGTALSVVGVAGNAMADHASIVAASDGQVLRRSGTAVGFGAVNLASANAITGALPLANMTALQFTEWWPAALNDGAPYGAVFSNAGDATQPNGAAFTGSNVITAVLEFSDATMQQIWRHFRLPSDWVGALDLSIVWKTSATTGNVVWQVQTGCSVDGATLDATLNAAQTVTDAAQGTTNRVNTATIASLTTTGLVAGGLMWVRIFRDPSHASDTIGADAVFIGAELKYRRQLA